MPVLTGPPGPELPDSHIRREPTQRLSPVARAALGALIALVLVTAAVWC
jgi:hypothetical protein